MFVRRWRFDRLLADFNRLTRRVEDLERQRPSPAQMLIKAEHCGELRVAVPLADVVEGMAKELGLKLERVQPTEPVCVKVTRST